jgi:hypothetical protein
MSTATPRAARRAYPGSRAPLDLGVGQVKPRGPRQAARHYEGFNVAVVVQRRVIDRHATREIIRSRGVPSPDDR